MKIRIFALAKELDMDSKLLIDFCAKAGIMVKASPLASISPEERDRVLGLIEEAGAAKGGGAAPPQPAVDLAPARDPLQDLAMKSQRAIRTMTARPQPSRLQPGSGGATTATMSAATIDEAPPAEAETAIEEANAAEADAISEGAPADVEEISTEVAVEEAPASQAVPASVDATDKPTESASTPPAAPEKPAFQPLTRESYIPPAGTARSVRTFNMTARGTNDASRPTDDDSKKAKTPNRPMVPGIAALGAFKGSLTKTPKPEEAKAQKPVIKLTQDEVQKASTPTGAQNLMDRINSNKKRLLDEDLPDDRRAGPKGPKERGTAVGLEESRAARKLQRKPGSRGEDDGEQPLRIPAKVVRRNRGQAPVTLKSTAEVESPITVRSLSEAMGRPAKAILSLLFQRGEMVNINASLDDDLAVELAMELGVDLHVQKQIDLEEEAMAEANADEDPALLQSRPPIVTILGHVDHGKTTLVDKLRSANVAAGEFGGITQHIAAYQVQHGDRRLTFVDTPGHAAFGEMRARGANVTDIVVLVVAANDGVMPQTVECIAHARAAGVPLVVAMNKIDLPDRNEQKVLQDLANQNVLASEWGGDIEVVRTSGMTGAGLDDLLETLLITADLQQFTANPDRPATGACLEAFRDEGRGPLAWFIVQKGTLRVGDVVLCGEAHGRIRALYNEHDQELKEAGPSTPVKVAGLDVLPGPGDTFVVMEDVEAARMVAEERRQKDRQALLATKGGRRTLEDILNAAREGQVQDLGLIIKADTPGSLEAIRHEIGKFEHPEVRVKVLHEGVGGVNESDVYLASASEAIIVAFHVIAEDRAEQLASQEKVDIRRYNIIYEVIDEIKMVLEGMLRPEKKQVTTGRAIVLRTFAISRFGTIAGCRVLNGTIERTNRINLIRDQKILNSYGIASLKREKDDAREVREGMECGIRLDGFNDIKEGDLLEAYRIEEVKRKYEDTQ